MSVKKIIRDYFYFSRRDRTGIITLVIIIILVYFLPEYFPRRQEEIEIKQGSTLAMAIDTLEAYERPVERKPGKPVKDENVTSPVVFDFNPNTLDESGWIKLGLNRRIVSTILRYRSKGGHFYKPEDLKKIWGLPETFYNSVKDHIILPVISKKENSDTVKFSSVYREHRKPSFVSINEADTTAFIALPGIGSKLATRIIAFRDKMGGFYSVDQLSEIYGLQDSTFQKIRPYLQVNGNVKKFQVNTVTRDELKMHPYFKWNITNAIISYREQHGTFKSLKELKSISLIDEKTFEKIVHYLEL